MMDRYFQWIAGDDKGKIATLAHIVNIDGEQYYEFTDGERCSLTFISPMTTDIRQLRGKLLVEIDSPTNPWEFYIEEPKLYKDESMRGQEIEIPSLHDITKAEGQVTNLEHSDVGTEKIRPPKRNQNLRPLPNPNDYPAPVAKNRVSAPAPEPTVQTVVEPVPEAKIPPETKFTFEPESSGVISINENNFVAPQVVSAPRVVVDPVEIFVNNCKKHETNVDLSLTLNIPSRELFKIADSEFEDGGEKFVNYIIQDLDINCIIDSLRQSLLDAYKGNTNDKNAEINNEN